ncbi:MAG: hypothetical protein JEZ12_13035 [Desulfobacterium sp.]|nr:hypothetical protein [Desulfobacterium sp.]
MGERAERSQWYRGKDPIMEEFSSQRRTIIDTVASRVEHPPGHLAGALTELETKTKHALSDLNYKIVAEAVERELAQQGLDMDMDYKNAAILWELEKARLLDALQRELADSKKTREDRESVLADLAVEVSLRQVALINAKTLIENELEGIRKEIVEAQGRSLPKEVELAQAKLVTAQRKLAIIPHLQALIAAEEDHITAEEANIPLTEELINKRLAQIPIKEELATLKELLVAAMDALTQPTLAVAGKKKLLAQARLEYENRAAEKVGPAVAMVAALERMNAALTVYINKKGELVDPYLKRATKLQDLIEPRTDYARALAETVPYVRELAIKRQELIAPSLAKAAALRKLISPLLRKAQETLKYAHSLKDMARIEKDTKEIHLDIEKLKRDGIDADLDIMKKRLDEGEFQQALVEANVILKRLETENRAALIDTDAVNSAEFLQLKETGQTDVVAKEMEAVTKEVDTRFDVAEMRIDGRVESVRTTTRARSGHDGSIEKISRLQADAREETAEANAAAQITSTLIHQLS